MSDLDKINSIFNAKIDSIKSKDELQNLKTEFFGKKGQITGQFKNLGSLSPDKKKEFASELNKLKDSLANQLDVKNLEIENKGQSETIANMEGMIIKLIGRWNESDSVRDRRYEQTIEAMSDMEKQLSRMDGIMSRMNGNGK